MIPAVIGLITKDEKIVVAQRPLDKPYAGYWEFPGGKIEAHESSEAALRRELHEELGIQVIAASYCFQHTHAYPDKTVQLDVWRVTDFVGECHSKENQALRFVSLPELLSLRLLEGNRLMMDQIRRLLLAL